MRGVTVKMKKKNNLWNHIYMHKLKSTKEYPWALEVTLVGLKSLPSTSKLEQTRNTNFPNSENMNQSMPDNCDVTDLS